MSTNLIKLILGCLLLNLVQVMESTPIAAQTLTPEVMGSISTVHQVATVKLNLLTAQQHSRSRRIQFARNANSAVLENSVVRGTRDIYLLGARARQKMTVSISSVEDNAVFDIIAPNQKTIKQEAKSWSFVLPATGDYRIIVGGTRGNATYRLRVEIN
jgi:hypothetical protein